MTRDEMLQAAQSADHLAAFLRGAGKKDADWPVSWSREDASWAVEQAHLSFRDVAFLMGYRVERIGDGINAGKPVVAGGM